MICSQIPFTSSTQSMIIQKSLLEGTIVPYPTINHIFFTADTVLGHRNTNTLQTADTFSTHKIIAKILGTVDDMDCSIFETLVLFERNFFIFFFLWDTVVTALLNIIHHTPWQVKKVLLEATALTEQI